MRINQHFFVRILLCLALFAPARSWAVGFTPTDAGLVVNFQPGDQFLLSVVIDGQEYFVSHYPSYTGGRFKYKAGHELRLIPQRRRPKIHIKKRLSL